MQERVQRFGGNLAAMVIPNIGAFIAWGLITAFFIPTGWIPNENLAKLVGPMIKFLLPLLIGYTGGKLVYGHRGGVVGAVVTAGIVIGSEVPMFLGAMIAGPLGGFLIKMFDRATQDKIPSGFEMLTNNFSAGILGAILAVLGLVAIGPVLEAFSTALGNFVHALINAGVLPLADIPIEVAKVLFLNNAINHGVLAPLGVIDAAKSGRAIQFLLETNPGPGLGLLLAFEPDPDRRDVGRRHHRRHHLRRYQRRSCRDPIAGQHLRLPRRHATRSALRRVPRSLRRCGGLLRGRIGASAPLPGQGGGHRDPHDAKPDAEQDPSARVASFIDATPPAGHTGRPVDAMARGRCSHGR
jgi:hypothetical protein